MLCEAFFWDCSAERPTMIACRKNREFNKLLEGWGRPGDHALIASHGHEDLGASWFRLWTPAIHSFGFMDANTPELTLAVAPSHRRKKIGRALLEMLICNARSEAYAALSVSVSPRNHALR